MESQSQNIHPSSTGDVEKGLSPEKAPQESLQHTPSRTARGPLSRIISTTSVASWDPGPPPDGGAVAWTQAIMAHFVIFNTWGYIASFGVFQTYYTNALGHPPSDISWVGSFQIFLLFFIGTASGRAMDAGLFKPVFSVGVILQCLGVFMTSLSTKYWQLFLAQGICTGLGNGLQFCPTMALLSTYFTKNRNFAIGICAAGTATGGLVFPVLVRELLPKIGFGWTVRIIGFVNLALGLMTVICLKTRLPPRKSGPLVEWSAFKEMPYTLYLIGMFLNFWGLYFAFYYVGSFARDRIGVSYGDSIDLLLLMNGVGIITRLLPNFIADKYTGPINTITPFAFASGIVVYGWSGVHTPGGLWAFAAMYGISSAGIQGLFPAGLSTLTTDPKKAGTRMGMGFSVVSIACLTGPPLAGALIQLHPTGSYLYAQMWAGSCFILGFVTLCAARIAKTGFQWKIKV